MLKKPISRSKTVNNYKHLIDSSIITSLAILCAAVMGPGALSAQTTVKVKADTTQDKTAVLRPLIPGRTLLVVSSDGSPPSVVNGEKISWSEFNQAFSRAAQSKFYHAKAPEDEKDRLRLDVAKQLILNRLLVVEASKRGIMSCPPITEPLMV
jgi:hypothetical protein